MILNTDHIRYHKRYLIRTIFDTHIKTKTKNKTKNYSSSLIKIRKIVLNGRRRMNVYRRSWVDEGCARLSLPPPPERRNNDDEKRY